jgi:choline dehydrogenase-like flavoprotein
MAAAGVMLHDETRGRVRPGWLGVGRPRIDYWPALEEQRSLVEGVKQLARLWFAAGAEAVVLPFLRAPLARNEKDLEHLEKFPFAPHEVALSSVHPQGSCPMGKDGACDEAGEVRGASGLWVADASVFPTSLGLPPQITTAALATRTAQNLAQRLKRGGLS